MAVGKKDHVVAEFRPQLSAELDYADSIGVDVLEISAVNASIGIAIAASVFALRAGIVQYVEFQPVEIRQYPVAAKQLAEMLS